MKTLLLLFDELFQYKRPITGWYAPYAERFSRFFGLLREKNRRIYANPHTTYCDVEKTRFINEKTPFLDHLSAK
jgi:hypothetical protein